MLFTLPHHVRSMIWRRVRFLNARASFASSASHELRYDPDDDCTVVYLDIDSDKTLVLSQGGRPGVSHVYMVTTNVSSGTATLAEVLICEWSVWKNPFCLTDEDFMRALIAA